MPRQVRLGAETSSNQPGEGALPYVKIAAADVEGAMSPARDLDEFSSHIRSLISIAKAMTKKPFGVPTASPRG